MSRIKLFTLLCLINIAVFTSPCNAQNFDHQITYARARILSIEPQQVIDDKTGESYVQTTFSLKILSGDLKDQTQKVVFVGKDSMPEFTKYQENDTIFIGFNKIGMVDGTDEYIALYDIDNSFGITIIFILLAVTIVGIGRLKGLFSMLALLFTIGMIFFVFVPLTLKGYPALVITVIISFLSIFVTIPVITGITRKAAAAICGASIGVLVATFLALICGWTMHLAGIITDGMIQVFYMAENQINLRDLALSGMIIAALGAVMDVAVSISSATSELFEANPKIEFKKAFFSSLTIGKDILGSMVNTLILAYVGSSLSIILIIYMKYDSQMPFSMILSHNPVLIEIIKSFVGSLGMFTAIPATAFIATRFYYNRNINRV
ncbi:MAG: YibE/F family protein [Spirochaetes bacterium]|jgi:uncharacterized membrane protein|nr:YibE/F family protein [Spirochaetota bacterium]